MNKRSKSSRPAPKRVGQETLVSRAEAAQWVRWVTPLPKRIRLTRKRRVPLADVRVQVPATAGAVEHFAAGELRVLLQQPEAAQPRAGQVTILLGVCDDQGRVGGESVPGATDLATLPNREQAYVIAPRGDHHLVLTGLDPRGVSYAARTLGQLLAARIADGQVEVPLARVTDWPDLGERGLWWYTTYLPLYGAREIDWLAGLKLNHLEIDLAIPRVAPGQPVGVTLTVADAGAFVERCRLRAVKVVPAIMHVNDLVRFYQLPVFDVFPETRAQPATSLALCFSQPATQRVLDEFFIALARTVATDDLMVWLSESGGCACAKCQEKHRQMGPAQFEWTVIRHAWRQARQVRPNLRLRLLLTEVSQPDNPAIIKSTPPEVGITYYHGKLTYTLARQPMIDPELRAAMAGRRLGCYPSLCALWYAAAPFSGVAYMQERLREFQQAGVVSLAGYAWPSLRLNDLTLGAAAEYAWNGAGRTPREFVRAWATRQRLPDPDRVARWWHLVEEPQRNLYNSHFALTFGWADIDQLLTARQAVPPGTAFLTGFLTATALADDLASVRRALPLAESIPSPRFAHETRYTLAMLEAVRSLRDLTVYVAAHPALRGSEKKPAAGLVAQTRAAFAQAGASLTAWDRSVALYPGQPHPDLETDGEELCRKLDDGRCWARPTVYFLQKNCCELDASARKLGLGPAPNN